MFVCEREYEFMTSEHVKYMYITCMYIASSCSVKQALHACLHACLHAHRTTLAVISLHTCT